MKLNEIGRSMSMTLKSIVTCLILAAASPVIAQKFQTLFSFSGSNGANPLGLTLGNDGTFYGTTSHGGSNDMGTVFKVTANGSFTTLVSFAGTNGSSPAAGLTLGNDGNFYGTTSSGGSSVSYGTLFRVTTNGTLTALASFSENVGLFPSAPLTLAKNGLLYGTTQVGGIPSPGFPSGAGTIFEATTNGYLARLTTFYGTNGSQPQTALTQGIDGKLYGTTDNGGYFGGGTVFVVTTYGAMTTLATFWGNSGWAPFGALTLASDGSFYGTTTYGGMITSTNTSGYGTIFRVTPNGSVTTLVSFSGSNGQYPNSPLTLWKEGSLFGTTSSGFIGQTWFPETLFQVTTNGTFTTMFPFPDNRPYGLGMLALTLGNDGNFYGTTTSGGIKNATYPGGMGMVFRLIPAPDIAVQPPSIAVVEGSHPTSHGTVADYGDPPFLFQWSFNGSRLAGGTSTSRSTSLTIYNFDLTKAGPYWVTVSNSYGTDTAFSVLRLTNSPVILVDGVDVGGGLVSRTNTYQITMSSTFGTNANIYYTVDGSAPNYLSTAYHGALQFGSSLTIRAMAYDSTYQFSAEAAPVRVEMVPIYPLTATTPGGGSLSFSPVPYSGGNLFVSNTLVTVSATPSNGWSFQGWLGDASGSSSVAGLTMNREMAVEAVFGTTVISNVLGAGEIQFSPQVPVYPFAATLSITAVPQTGNYLINWAGALSGSANPIALVVNNAGQVVTALFAPLSAGQYALTVLSQGEGRITMSPYTNRYASGSLVTVTAIPNAGQTFAGWSGDATGLQNPLTMTMTQSKVITANFTTRYRLSTAPPLNRMAEQGFRFSLLGELGAAYRIDGSSDLSSWVPLGWVTNDLGTAQFLDPAALTNRVQFYRAVAQ